MATLTIMRGLPASGKSTWARKHVRTQPAGRGLLEMVPELEMRQQDVIPVDDGGTLHTHARERVHHAPAHVHALVQVMVAEDQVAPPASEL